MPDLPDIGQNSEGVFPVSGFLVKALINTNFHNFRTDNDNGMKLGSLTNFDKRNAKT